jgi:hypothetical protein
MNYSENHEFYWVGRLLRDGMGWPGAMQRVVGTLFMLSNSGFSAYFYGIQDISPGCAPTCAGMHSTL